ncbi:MAG: hypothetical protein VKO21_08370 [Candidatus Sericytochromatia bacterium]|nr:hypothetical protein [Candidatus Sericytochromatia bacterium]
MAQGFPLTRVPGMLALVLAVSAGVAGCWWPNPIINSVAAQNNQLYVGDQTDITVVASTNWGREMQYQATAARGRIIQANSRSRTFRYIAPFTAQAPDNAGNQVIGDRVTIRVIDGTAVVDQLLTINLNGSTVVFKDEANATNGQGQPCQDSLSDCNGPLYIGVVDEVSQVVRNIRPLVNRNGQALKGTQPAISPDGRRIAFVEYTSIGGSSIQTVDAAGDMRTVVIAEPAVVNVDPSWTAPGNELLYASTKGGNGYDIYRAIPDQQGSAPIRLTSTGADERFPSVNPTNSDQLVVSVQTNALGDRGTRSSTAAWNLCTFDRRRSDYVSQLTNLSQPGDYALETRWRPDGQWIAFTQNGPVGNDLSTAKRFQRVVIQNVTQMQGAGCALTAGVSDNQQNYKESNPVWSPRNQELFFLQTNGPDVVPGATQLRRILPNLQCGTGQPGGVPQNPQLVAVNGVSIPGIIRVTNGNGDMVRGGASMDWR